MKKNLQKYSLSFLLILGWLFVPLSWVFASVVTPTVPQSPSGSISTPLPALINQSMAVCGSEEVSVGYTLSWSQYKIKCMSITDIRAALNISATPLACWAGKIAKGISGDGTVLQCRSLPPGCWLTQPMADELNRYSYSSKTIDEWCKTKELAIFDVSPRLTPNPTDGKIHLPNGIRKLRSLTTLTIMDYPVEVVDPWIGNLAQLENLVIISPKLTSVPASLWYLSNLKKLIISGGATKAPISVLPSTITNLTSLDKLAITQTNINQLPTSFGQLSNLTSLSLQNNYLTSLPNSIGDLTRLVWTVNEPYVSGYPINTWYPGNCTTKHCFFWGGNYGYYTGSLDVSGNQLSYIPSSITQLTNIVWINVSNNPLTGSGSLPALPSDFGKLTNMREFILENTAISVLPESFSGLTNLGLVSIIGNPNLTRLPQDFGKLSSLSKLHLHDNGLEELPESFGDLPEFVMDSIGPMNSPTSYGTKNTLNLANNRLTRLPNSIIKFKNRWLTTLYLDGNQIRNFPMNIGSLDTLVNIYLRSNNLIGNDWVANLEKTTANTIFLDSNQLQTLPDIFSSWSFVNLSSLLISSNQLNSLPSSFGYLSKLRTLNISGNRFTTFPNPLTNLVNPIHAMATSESLEGVDVVQVSRHAIVIGFRMKLCTYKIFVKTYTHNRSF